ncbi:MAG: phosphoribosylformylglycinamidine synthase subunit PurQ [Solirubrobacterales bacterium]|nr:phosphoribosylformylglycinamidine synthase subunit PurQ [Solirubrobacterales bacterium]
MNFGVVQFPGTCDERDAVLACERVEGASAQLLWHGETSLDGIDAVVIPGGFSYGDYLRVGAIARFSPMMESVARFASDGGVVLGICNGFQVLCEAGLLPGALLPNVGLRFVCRQVGVEVVNAETSFTRACEPGQVLSIPVKHTTGRYYAPGVELERMEAHGQIVLRYAHDGNPNGSSNDIAGVSNEAGNVMGLMPHPEHAVDPLTGSVDGLTLFTSMAVARV